MTVEWLWLVLLGCSAATFLWRGAGVILVRRIDADSAIFQWITCVSYAMVAGLVFRMLIIPESELAQLPLWLRGSAIALAFAAYFIAGQRLVAGVVTGGVSLSLMAWLFV